jgi:hypothetical protein
MWGPFVGYGLVGPLRPGSTPPTADGTGSRRVYPTVTCTLMGIEPLSTDKSSSIDNADGGLCQGGGHSPSGTNRMARVDQSSSSGKRLSSSQAAAASRLRKAWTSKPA